jgi:uncharacterized protein (TIGR02246 family)
MRRNHFHVIAVLALAACRTPDASGALSAADSTAIRTTQAEYVRAWLADDTAAVLATLSRDALLLPPRGLPVKGDSAIRAYWWPADGSRTKITSFNWDVEEVSGTPSLAYTRGQSALAWTYDKDTLHQVSSSKSINLTLFRREADGSWRIARQMWGPPLP